MSSNYNSINVENKLHDDFYILEIKILEGTQKSAKMEATLQLLYSWSGIFHDWKINFHICIIDRLTTASWIIENNMKYKTREKLFNFIQIDKQGYRNKKHENLLCELSSKQIIAYIWKVSKK